MKKNIISNTIKRLGIFVVTLSVVACGSGRPISGADNADPSVFDASIIPVADSMVAVNLNVSIPKHLADMGIPMNVIVTVAGNTRRMNNIDGAYFVNMELPANSNYPVYFAIARASDNLILESTQTDISTVPEIQPFAEKPEDLAGELAG